MRFDSKMCSNVRRIKKRTKMEFFGFFGNFFEGIVRVTGSLKSVKATGHLKMKRLKNGLLPAVETGSHKMKNLEISVPR